MRRLALILLLLQLARAESASATTGTALAELSVSREPDALAAGCADEQELERRVVAILGRPLSGPGRNGEVVIAVRFRREGEALVGDVSAKGPKPGVRTLRDVSSNCQALSEGVAIAVALLLDGAHRSASVASRDSRPAEASVAPPAIAPRESARPAAKEVSETTWQARANLAGAASYGLGGSGTWLGLGRLGARNVHWVIDLGVGGSVPTRESFDGGSVRSSLWLGTARGCYLAAAGTVGIGPCAQLGVGWLRGAGENYGETRSSALMWTALSLGLGAELPLGQHVAVTLEGSIWVPLQRHTFSVQNRGTAWESKPAAGLLGLGLAFRLF